MMLMLPMTAAALAMTIQNDPVNRLDFVSGEIAAMMRVYGQAQVCVASVNGRPNRRGDQGICYILGAVHGFDILSHAGAGTQVEVVQTLRVDGTAPPVPSDMGSATPLAHLSARLSVRPDGSIATCTEGPGRVLRRVPGFVEPPPVCETYLPGRERVFADAPPGVARRTAQLDITYYLRPR